MKDEMGQFVPDLNCLPLSEKDGVEVAIVRPLLCARCGHSMAAHQWLHMEKALQRGFQEMECLNSSCKQFRQVARVPIMTQFFAKV